MMMHDFSSSNHCIPHKIQTSPGGHQSCCYCCCSSLLLDKTPFKKDDSCTCFSSPSSTLDFYPDEAFVHLYEGMNNITGAPTCFRQEFSKNQKVTKGEKTRQSLFTFSKSPFNNLPKNFKIPILCSFEILTRFCWDTL